MSPRRGRWLGGVLAAAVVLVGGGTALFFSGLGGHSDLGRVLGILAIVLGLICLRVLAWARRARVMAQIGMDLRQGHPRTGGSQDGEFE